ncbi:organic hydroperoxide resistance protein [Aestuariirhabdus sp. Z084]|uniref:organic hydroperoxide resistance protein n=1 Tax=Aestuariirhabdus haliotis TaxID=2918751 RepID=UPI00201B432A|nr:organic hydroperoxide resistance protein [Aestuariirhabdus haliotis]MCL6416845.1 organic hydroperoxide resistance protein [Aestuariirhabdus haliotis]MCL6420845.1 organic hydroperoxide resistance protein [Aestuariirhabdus haliotis]
MKPEKIVYSAQAISTGGREGYSESSDKALAIKLSTPKALGGAGGDGTNPEQLFAAGYSACFLGALKYVAQKQKVALPESTNVAAEVGIGPVPNGFALEVTLTISINGVPEEQAQSLIEQAHIVCPYSNATRNNIDVKLVLSKQTQ